MNILRKSIVLDNRTKIQLYTQNNENNLLFFEIKNLILH